MDANISPGGRPYSDIDRELLALGEIPFNLAGESQSSELTAEAEARVRALAESEARKAQAWLILKAPVPGKATMEKMCPNY